MDVAGDLVLLDQAAAEEQRVVRPQRHRNSGLDEVADRDFGRAWGDAERDVGRRAHLAGDAVGGEPLDQRRIFRGPDPVAQPGGMQPVHGGDHTGRPGQLAGVRHEQQSSSLGDPEGAFEVAGRAAALVVGQAEADDAFVRVLRGEPREGPRVERVFRAVRGEDDRDPDAGGTRRRGHGVEQELGERRQAAERRRETRRVRLQFEPSGAFGPLVFRDFAHQAPQVVGGAQH